MSSLLTYFIISSGIFNDNGMVVLVLISAQAFLIKRNDMKFRE